MKAIALYPTDNLKSWLHENQIDFDSDLFNEAMIFLVPHKASVSVADDQSFSFLKTASSRFMDANVGVDLPNLTSTNFEKYFRYEVFADVVNLGRNQDLM